jgi:hypothetical protein
MPSPPYHVGKAVEIFTELLDLAKLLEDRALLDDDLTTLEELRFTEELDFGIVIDDELTGVGVQIGSP